MKTIKIGMYLILASSIFMWGCSKKTDSKTSLTSITIKGSDTMVHLVTAWAEAFMTIDTCPECNGQRLKKESLHFKIHDKNISELSMLDLNELEEWFNLVDPHLTERQTLIGKDILKEK